MKNILAVFFALTSAFGVHAQSGNVYANGQLRGGTYEATVLQATNKMVEADWRARSTGVAIGGLLGTAAIGRTSGKYGAVKRILGGAIGGLLGERAANAVAQNSAQEIVLEVQEKTGVALVTIVQPAPYDAVTPGQQVWVTVQAGRYRVLPRYYASR
jgi:outer membrane lipoprotein SlyB